MGHSDPNRIFYGAMFASLALHALLLLSFPDLLSSARRAVESFPPPILARLLAPEPAAPPEAEKPPAPPPPVQKPKPSVSKPIARPAPAPSPLPAPAVEPDPTPPAPPAPPVAAAESTPAPAPPAPVQAPVAVAPPTQQSGESAAAREARTIGEYRLELIEAARRIKDRTRYPPIARDNNWTGNTNVNVAVPAGGAPAVTVRGTSGHQVLDQHALNIFRQATQEVPVPQALRDKAFVVEVRMDFTLKD